MKFKFPDTGEGVTEGKFLEWQVEVGDEVDEDQIVGSAETDKAVVDIPAPSDGVVKELKASPGDTVKVGDIIMILDTDGEVEQSKETETDEDTVNEDGEASESVEQKEDDSSSDEEMVDAVMGGAPSASSYSDEDEREEHDAEQENERPGNDTDVLALPKVRKKAEEMEIDLSQIDKDGRITEEDLENVSGKQVSEPETIDNGSEETQSKEPREPEQFSVPEDVNARPSVKRLARKKNIDLSKVEGSGKGGEILREDLEHDSEPASARDAEESEARSEEPEVHVGEEGLVEKVDMSGVRKATASKMTESKFTAPHVTHVEKADITELVELRESVKDKVDAHLTYLPFVMKALVAGLKEYPDLNAELDQEKDQIIRKKYYNFNIAVNTDRGLLVPKIEDVDSKNMVELAESVAEKAEKAQKGDLQPKEMEAGTFSITNLGVIGGEEFTPIIYPPQTAILGIGKISETAEVVDGEVIPRMTVKLSLSYDHRVVDGAEAARFMNKVVEDLENPRELILDM